MFHRIHYVIYAVLSLRHARRPRGNTFDGSCHVSTLHRILRSIDRTHFITAYQDSISSGLVQSVSTQKAIHVPQLGKCRRTLPARSLAHRI
jgi:hypothetical protein